MNRKILIKNGKIVTHNRILISDILIKDEKIESIEKNIGVSGFKGEVIDAENMLVLPGAVDPHVHMELPVGNRISSDNFESGSIAAISGGTTTLIDFVTPLRGEDLGEALKKRKKLAERSYCDYGLHMSVVSLHDGIEDQIKRAVNEWGVPSFKLYMAYKSSVGMSDKKILKTMKLIGESGGIAMIHCENGDAAEFLLDKYLQEGKRGIKYYPDTRPDKIESDAVGRAILFSEITGCPLYVVHISSEESLKVLYSGRESGAMVLGETCPHYLILNNSVYNDYRRGKKYLMSPPLREESDNISLWDAISDGLIDTVSTDHCPFAGKGDNGSYPDDISKIPKGVGGVEFRLKLLYTFGVLTGRISLNRFVNIISTRPAKIFGLYPKKGAIRPGSDADLVLWDPEKSEKISVKEQFQNCDTNIYEGIEVKGAPVLVMRRSEIILQNGLFDISTKRGAFQFRGK